jgi:hypothetical protein
MGPFISIMHLFPVAGAAGALLIEPTPGPCCKPSGAAHATKP